MMFKLDDNHYRKSQRPKAKSIILKIKKKWLSMANLNFHWNFFYLIKRHILKGKDLSKVNS